MRPTEISSSLRSRIQLSSKAEGPDALRLELDQAVAQLVQLDVRELDLALEVVLAPHRSPRRSSSRTTERMPL